MDKDAEEKAAEQAALEIGKEEEVRAGIIAEYGFDEEADAERIDKLTAKEMEHSKKLRSAIGAKIKHRTEAEELKKNGAKPQTPKEDKKDEPNLTTQDTIALAKADVSDEDMDEIISHAKFKGISVRDALKTPYIKAYMAEQQEFRKTADAANAGTGRRVTNKLTPDTLVKDLSEGKVPEKGTKAAEELFWARRGGRR